MPVSDALIVLRVLDRGRLERRPVDVDRIVGLSGLTVGRAGRVLAVLEGLGWACRVGDGWLASDRGLAVLAGLEVLECA